MRLTNFAGSDQLMNLFEVGIKAPIEANLQLDPGRFDCLKRLVDFCQVKGNRFLAEYKLSGSGGFLDQLGMGVGAGTDDDRFDGFIIENVMIIGGDGWNTVIGSTASGGFRLDIGNGQNLRLRNTISQILGMHPANATRTDDANGQYFHRLVLSHISRHGPESGHQKSI
jgi:hypothetical protein